MVLAEPFAGPRGHADSPNHAGSAIACTRMANFLATLYFIGSKSSLRVSLTSISRHSPSTSWASSCSLKCLYHKASV